MTGGPVFHLPPLPGEGGVGVVAMRQDHKVKAFLELKQAREP